MTLLSHQLFQHDLLAPAQILQQLEQSAVVVERAAEQLPDSSRHQLQRQTQEVLHDAQELCRLVSRQQQLAGRDPLSEAAAAAVSLSLVGLDAQASGGDDDAAAAADEPHGALVDGGLSQEAEQQLRRVFAVTDSLNRQQVRGVLRVCAACRLMQQHRPMHRVVMLCCANKNPTELLQRQNCGACDGWMHVHLLRG